MSRHASTHRARPQLERLGDRCTPSALLGNPSAHALADRGEPPAPTTAVDAGAPKQAVPIRLSAHIASDGSLGVSLEGVGGHLGRWTGQGSLDSVVIDPVAGRGAVSGTVPIIAANGDRLFASFSASWDLTTGLGGVTITFTGGTGRFAGASGGASLVCHVTADPASPLTFECNNEGFGTLILAHR